MNVTGLLHTYYVILHLLRHHGVIRCFSNPVGGVTEWLVSTKLGLKPLPNSTADFDAEDLNGTKYQIKGRWLASHGSSKKINVELNLDANPFDYMIAVIFDDNFQVDYAAQIPISFIRQHSKPNTRSNGYRFNFTRKMRSLPGLIDLTEILSEFPPSTDMERCTIAAHKRLLEAGLM